jgi:hypothetical protein
VETPFDTQEFKLMTVVGKVESLWRYPVKSMRGEEISQSYLGFSGVYGDRLYAFHDKSAPEGFPFLTGREQEQMLRYQPRFRYPDHAASPPNLAEAEANEPGLTPVYADTADLAMDVQTPSGEVLAIDDPALIVRLCEGLESTHALSLLRSHRSFHGLPSRLDFLDPDRAADWRGSWLRFGQTTFSGEHLCGSEPDGGVRLERLCWSQTPDRDEGRDRRH